MPYFTLNRDWVLSGFGHVINFYKGEETWVPPLLVSAAVAIGAQAVDGDNPDPLPPEAPVEELVPLEERDTLIFAAFEQVLARADQEAYREDFNAQGQPNVKAIEKIVGFNITAKERNELWLKFQAQQAE